MEAATILNRIYVAVIGDLITSRSLEAADRSALHDRLAAGLVQITHDHSAGVAARPRTTLGDEFQALLHLESTGARALLALLTTVQDCALPLSMRFGIGIGTLTTRLEPEAIGMDGPCFHRAREALQLARTTKLPCWLFGENNSAHRVWSLLGCHFLRQREAWTDPQRAAIRAYRELGSWKEVAMRMGVTQGAITQRHRAAGWDIAKATEEALELGLLDLGAGAPIGTPSSP